MEFMNRTTRPQEASQPGVAVAHGSRRKSESGWLKVTSVILLFSLTLLAIALILSFVFTSSPSPEKYLNTKKYQAVFLNNGQVYFGKIGKLNDRFVTLTDIYYLRVNQQVQPGQTQSSQDVSLAKLGNELHGPDDVMVINAREVQFWENLKDDGQVVTAIKKYKENPTAAQQNSTTPASTTPSTTTPTTPTTKKP